MPPHGDPEIFRTRFPVIVRVVGEDVSPGWQAIVNYLPPDANFSGTVPDSLLIGFTREEYYRYYSDLYNLLLYYLGFTPSK